MHSIKTERSVSKSYRTGLRYINAAISLGILCIALAIPLTLSAAVIQRYLYSEAQKPDASTGTGQSVEVLHFAQASDAHIMDEGNPIRTEELRVLVESDPAKYLELGVFLGSVIPPAHRDTGIYTALIWEAVIQSINDEHLGHSLDFIISTGDHTDTGIMDELIWFIALAEGRVPADFMPGHANRLGQRTIRPENPEALLMPLYVAVGNHDIEYQGTFNNDGFVGLLIRNLAYDPQPDKYYINNLAFLEDVLAIEHGYGLTKDMPTQGYYTFDPNALVHCIVLNTSVYYAPTTGWPLETLSLGALSMPQYAWMKQEIENNADKLCIIFAHHGAEVFFPLKDDLKYYISASRLQQTLQSYENVIAYLSGHTHENHIYARSTATGTGYWDINTCGVADYPQEWRTISIRDNGDGTGTIACRMQGHAGVFGNQSPYENIDTRLVSLAELGEAGITALGQPGDRDADLNFIMPARVQETIKALAAINQEGDASPEEGAANDSPASGSDDNHSKCFIMTARF